MDVTVISTAQLDSEKINFRFWLSLSQVNGTLGVLKNKA